MKKSILFILVWVLTSLFLFGQDVTAPEVKSITFSTDTLRGNDTLEIIITITDEESNIPHINMVLTPPSLINEVRLLDEDWTQLNDSIFKASLPIVYFVDNAVFEIESVIVGDDSPSGNTRNYGEGDFDNKVVIHSTVNDREAPELKSITFSTDTLRGEDSLEIVVTVTDDYSNIEFFSMRLYSPNDEHVDFSIQNQDWIKLNDTTLKAIVSIVYFSVNDVFEIESANIYDDSPSGNARFYEKNDFDNKVVIYSSFYDNEAPELKSITFSTDTIRGRDSLEIVAVVTDDLSNLSFFSLEMYNIEHENSFAQINFLDWVQLNDSTLKAIIPIVYFFPNGLYKIRSVNIYDDARLGGNGRDYGENDFDNEVVIHSNVNDIEDPEVKSITFSTDTLKGNDSLEIIVIATDDYSNIQFFDMQLSSQNNPTNNVLIRNDGSTMDWIILNDSTLKAIVPASSFISDGVFEIESVNISDDSPYERSRYYGEDDFDNKVVVDRNITGLFSNEEEGFVLFPNPTNSVLHINVKKNVSNEIQIIDQYGETVRNVVLNMSEEVITIDVSGIEPGIYFLKQGHKSSKVVIQK